MSADISGGYLSLHTAAWGGPASRTPSVTLKASWRVDGGMYSWTLGVLEQGRQSPN